MRKYIVPLATIPVLAAMALLAGCGLLSRGDTTPVNQYQIAPDVSLGNAPAETCGLVVRVRNVTANTPWATNGMLYTQTEHSIESFAYNRWAAAPATMLTDALVQAMDTSKLYRGVLGPVSAGDSDLTLTVTLRKGPLQSFSGQGAKENASSGSSRESLALAANLTETDSGQLIASEEFSASQSAAPNPYGGVVAANALAGKLIEEMLGWLAQTNATISCKAGD